MAIKSNLLGTNLIGESGHARIWANVATPIVIVAVYAVEGELRACVKATETLKRHHDCGKLYTVGVESITLS